MAQPNSKLMPHRAEIFLELLSQLQRIDPEFPLHYSICLTHISLNEGMSLTTLSERTGLALSTVSRIVGALANDRQNGNAYGLVELKISPQERRRKELYLTPKGWAVMRSVTTILDRYRTTGI